MHSLHHGPRDWFLDQLAMYAAYHQDRRNQLTHHVGVPLIVFSLLLALSQVRIAEVGGFPLDAGAVVLALLMLSYIAAIPVTGLFTAIFYGVIYGVVLRIAREGQIIVWSVAGAGFVVGWIIQFIGHVFEGRRPALTVNALQAFMAPPFLIAEVLFAAGFESALALAIARRSEKYLPK